MAEDRRSQHGSGLREFFNEQIAHLHGLLTGLHDDQPAQTPIAEADKQVIEHFVDVANSKLRMVDDYADKLRTEVCGLYHHVLDIAEQIPSPVELSHEAFAQHALVNALFVTATDVDSLLVKGSEVEAFWHHHGQTPQFYALLSALKREKNVLGVGMRGDFLVRDLPQQTVNFSSHKLHLPCTSSSELDMALKSYLLDQVIVLLRQDLGTRSYKQTMESGDHSYQARLSSLANPEVYLQTLIEVLQTPAKLLSIENCHYRLSKMGIKLEECDDNQCINLFDIPELSWSDGSKNVLLQVVYSVVPAE